mgnify:CR=1 FL=1
MKTIIQSFSDIITNSSSEVFVFSKKDDLIEALTTMKIDYVYYENEQSLRKAVKENAWGFDYICSVNPYREWWMEDIKTEKTSDEIWEFFKSFYTHLIGKVIVDVDRDYLYNQEDEHNIYLRKFIKE